MEWQWKWFLVLNKLLKRVKCLSVFLSTVIKYASKTKKHPGHIWWSLIKIKLWYLSISNLSLIPFNVKIKITVSHLYGSMLNCLKECLKSKMYTHLVKKIKAQHVLIPYFFYIFDHLKLINFFADQIIGITPKMTEILEPDTNCIPDAPVHVCFLIVKVRRCRTHITWVTFGYYRFRFHLFKKKTIAEE